MLSINSVVAGYSVPVAFPLPSALFPQHLFNLYESMSLLVSPLLKGPASDGLSSGDFTYRLKFVEER